mgnify:CR=1 FL=1
MRNTGILSTFLQMAILSGILFCGHNADKTQKRNIAKSDSQTVIKHVTNNISTLTVSDSALFGIWTTDTNGPHADFMINQETYYIVDNDGQSEFPYNIAKDTITISFPDIITRGTIIKADNDTLIIKWDFQDPITYVRWKN